MHLLKHFRELTVRPKNAKELKGLVLQLAIQGKLTVNWRNENPDVEPASKLLKRIQKEKEQFIRDKKIKKDKPLSNVSTEEKKFEVPESWEWSRLRELGTTLTGGTPSKSNPLFFGNDIPFIKPGDIQQGTVNYQNEGLSILGKDKLSRAAPAGSILMVCLGTIGKCAIIERECTFNQQINSIHSNLIDSYYLLIALSSKYFYNIAWLNSTSTTIALLNKGKWENIPLPIPPLEEQKAIVEIVDALLKEVEQLEQLTVERISLKEKFVASALSQLTKNNFKNEWTFLQEHFHSFFNENSNIKKLRETVLQLAVQGKLTADWRAYNPNIEDASVLLERIKAEKKQLVKEKKMKDEKQITSIIQKEIPFSLPETWVWCRMQDLCPNISSGSTPPKTYFKEEGVPYLKVYNIKNQKIDFEYRKQFVDTQYHSTKLKRSILKPGDVIMNIVGPPLGKVAIIPNDFPEWNCNQAISFFQPLDRKLNTWIYTFLLAGTFLDRIELIGTAGQDNISVTKSKTIMLPLPPFEEQKAIVQKVNSIMDLCDVLEQQVQQSQEQNAQLMQSVLREVFEGKKVLVTI